MGNAVTITVTWNNAGTTGSFALPQAFKNRIASGNTVTVIFSTGTSDRIRFDRIGELRAALIAEGVSAGNITMKSSGETGTEVAPVFNADDMFVRPAYYWMPIERKALTEYGDGEKVYGNFAMHKASVADGISYHLSNGSHEKLYVEKLTSFIEVSIIGGGGSTVVYHTNGFGLQSSLADIVFDENAVIGGGFLNATDFSRALNFIGITTGNVAAVSTLFSPLGLNVLSYTENVDYQTTNLAGYPLILGFIESYLTPGNVAKLDGLNFDIGHFILQKTNPTAEMPYR
jgi:hypothetical protein